MHTADMLQKGFLGQLAGWVMTELHAHRDAFDASADAFALTTEGVYELASAQDGSDLEGLFTEWLVFDRTQEHWGNRSGLEQFVASNPLRLLRKDMDAYTDLLRFEVGLFEVIGISPGSHVVVESLQTGTVRTVYDVNASVSLRGGEIVWTRIAPVLDVYHMAGSMMIPVPIHFGKEMRHEIRSWEKNSWDAHEAAKLRYGKKESPSTGSVPNTKKEAQLQFEKALSVCGMEGFFTIKRFTAWVQNEEKYGHDFPQKALGFLIPENTAPEKVGALLEAGSAFSNLIPRKQLGGLTPSAVVELEMTDPRYDMETYSWATYENELIRAHELLQSGKVEEAYRIFEATIQRLLDNHIPAFPTFRIFANAGIACMMRNDDNRVIGLGGELLEASLRINPKYDFGKRSQQRFFDTYADISHPPKRNQARAQELLRLAQHERQHTYRKTAFYRYERFLRDVGITLSYATKTKPTAWRVEEDGVSRKLGRNDPCYCNSGKKFKKCCGR